MVRREPENPFDGNAVRIDNVRRQQIGHLGRDIAAKLAPFMDSGDLIIEGALTGLKGEYKCPVALKLFGTTEQPAMWDLRKRMMEVKLPVKELDKAEAARQKRQRELDKQQKARDKEAARLANTAILAQMGTVQARRRTSVKRSAILLLSTHEMCNMR